MVQVMKNPKPNIQLSTRVTRDEHDQVKDIAKRFDYTISDLLRMAIKHVLDTLETAEVVDVEPA